MKQLILGIDFDGTIVEEGFPNIGAIRPKTVELMKKAYELGHLVIVWTARSVQYEQDCINFLNENNIPYHYINCNPEDPYAIRGEQGRKIFCHYYLDDRAVHVDDIDEIFAAVEGKHYEKYPCKAKVRQSFNVGQVFEDGYVDEVKTFERGAIVDVLMKTGCGQYVIYDSDLDESTVVYEGFLEFID